MNPPVEGCPERLDAGSGVSWWLSTRDWADTALQATGEIREPATICDGRLLKAGVRRLVFAGRDAAGTACIVKAFPLARLESRLKHRKYAYNEARNLWRARQRGVPAPRVYGLGRERVWGTVRWNAVMMQRLHGLTFTAALAAAGDDSARRDVMRRSAMLLRTLFLAGCNHIDLKPEALRLADRAVDDAVLDFQYCTFRDQPKLATIMAQAGHFAHWWDQDGRPEAAWVEDWIAILLEVLEVPAARHDEALSILTDHRRSVRSIAERLRQ